MFTLACYGSDGEDVELFGVFAKQEAAASALESIIDANKASGEYPEDEYEASWEILEIGDVECM